MDIVILLVILSQVWHDSTEVTTDGKPWDVPKGTETSSLPFAIADTTEPQSLKLPEITNNSERSSLNIASLDSKLAAIVSDSTTVSLNIIRSDNTVSIGSEMTEASTPEAPVANVQTHLPNESLTVLKTLERSLEGKLVPTATLSAEPHPEVIPDADPNTRNRTPRRTLYSSGSLSANQKKASFETTRGKNWCAYVHTRLAPSITADTVETFISAVKDPCTVKIGGCPIRYQMVTRPAYRMRHKIVTSLEWKCCPGYSGEKCQIIVLKYQLQKHENQAESNNAINGGASGDRQQISPDPALTQKMSEQIYEQDMKLTSLQKKVDNISSAINEVHNTMSSLEGKINEDNPGKSIQSFLKGLKSKTITELVKDIVREQMKGFQTDMQETVAQLFKTISSLSVEVESTKETIKHLNETVASVSANQKIFHEQEPMPTMGDILDLKNHIVRVEEEITSVCDSSLKDLKKSHASLASELEREQSRSSIYYESLNTTLSKMRDVHDQLLCEESAHVPNVPSMDASIDDNVTEYLLTLQEKVKKQSIMMLQLYQDISAQDIKINNFTITLELQKESIQRACEARFSKCRNDFENKIRSTEETVHVLNKTMSDVVLPMDDKIDKMNEQINDLCYDMEILQPFIEQGAPFGMTSDYDRQIDVATVNKQLEDLSVVVNSLSSTVRELAKGQVGLRSEAESQNQVFEQRIAACLLDIEDGLNNTMTVLNNAVDFIKDNYVLKESMLSMKNNSQLLNQTVHKLDTLLGLIPQFSQLNESVRMLVHNNLQQQQTFITTEILSNVSMNELKKHESPDLVSVFHIVNETTAKVDQCLQNVSQLEQKLRFSAQDNSACEARIQNMESQITEIMTNSTLSLKPKKGEIIAKEKQEPIYPKYQELNSRIRALEAKSIRLSTSMPLLNKTVYETQGLCQSAFVSIQNVNASMPWLIRNAQPNITILQEVLKELVKSATDVKTETIWSSLTAYINKSTSDVISNVAKLQKQMKLVIKKTVPPKKTSTNVTLTLVGRSQRNTDNTAEQDDSLGCNNSPCLNGGTCINDRDSFVCACRHPFGGVNCSIKMSDENTLPPDFSKGSYRYAPMVTFFVSHTYGMTVPGPIKFNNLYVNYGASYVPGSGKFLVPYLGVYVFKYTIESFSPRISGYLVVDGIDKLAFKSENINSSTYSDRVVTGDALLELNYGQEVWLRLAAGSIPAKYPPVTTFGGFLLYRT